MTSNTKHFKKNIFPFLFTNVIEAGVSIPYKHKIILHCTEEIDLQTHILEIGK